MAYTTINKSTDYFNTVLYTSNNGTSPRTISGVGFQPDFVWVKNRDSASYNHVLNDSVRGLNKILSSDTNGAELAANHAGGYISSANNDGFVITAGSSNLSNYDTGTNKQVVWNWKAGGGAGSANTDGDINTTSTSVNTTAGFSISKYTGTGANATVGHGLGSVPAMIMIKNLGGTDSWMVYHKNSNATPEDYILQLNTTIAATDNNTIWNDTAPTSSVFSIGTDAGVNANGANYIAYCFAEKTGYSKFGSYTGNGNNDGPFIYTGFKPTFVLTKMSSAIDGWSLTDSVRDKAVTPNGARLLAETTQIEQTNQTWALIEKFSNGFKLRGTDNVTNLNGGTYIYMAIGQSIVGSNNVPAVAR